MLTPKLETERLVLREIHPEDADEIFSCWMQDESVSRYMWWQASTDFRETQKFVEYELANLENDKWNRWIIIWKETNAIIGTCLLYENEAEGHWDISYNLGRKYQGNGYTEEAMRAVLTFAFQEKKVQEIATSYAEENKKSGNVLRKLGFREIREVPYVCCGGKRITTGKYCVMKGRDFR